MTYKDLSVDRHGQVFVITLRKAPENRISTAFAQEIIRAFRDIERTLGPHAEGAVITRGSDAKFFCTVRAGQHRSFPSPSQPHTAHGIVAILTPSPSSRASS